MTSPSAAFLSDSLNSSSSCSEFFTSLPFSIVSDITVSPGSRLISITVLSVREGYLPNSGLSVLMVDLLNGLNKGFKVLLERFERLLNPENVSQNLYKNCRTKV